MPFSLQDSNPERQGTMRNTDRIIVLKLIDTSAKQSKTGSIDTRILTGDNKLHAKMDPTSCFWSLSYEHGFVPDPLKQQFTSFAMLLKFIKEYFRKRNIEVTEIID